MQAPPKDEINGFHGPPRHPHTQNTQSGASFFPETAFFFVLFLFLFTTNDFFSQCCDLYGLLQVFEGFLAMRVTLPPLVSYLCNSRCNTSECCFVLVVVSASLFNILNCFSNSMTSLLNIWGSTGVPRILHFSCLS